MAAIEHYERVYWDHTWTALEAEPDVRVAVSAFFGEAADIPTTPSAPCGCVIVLGAINVPAEYQDIADTLRDLREQERVFFVDRLKRGVVDGQLDAAMDVKAVATALLTLLEGMSIEAGDSAAKTRLQ